MAEHVLQASPRRNARIAGTFYLLTFLTGLPSLFVRGGLGIALGIIAGACYIAVTVLFYFLFKPVNKVLSLSAMVVSLVGCAIGPISAGFHFKLPVNPLVVFGFYCLLIGYLIFRSTFLPAILGAFMAFAGVGWLTFLFVSVANRLQPYNLIPGLIGEGLLTVWLLLKGVKEQQWCEQARAARMATKAGVV